MTNKIFEDAQGFLIERYLNGFKSFKAKKNHAKLMNQYDVFDFLKLPLKIAFLDRNSTVINMTDSNAFAWSHESAKEIIGKSITNFYHPRSAKFSIMHDNKVLKSNQLITEEEDCIRQDGIHFQAITAKMPWYNDENRVIGIVAVAITLGLNDCSSIQNSLELFTSITSASHHLLLHPMQDDVRRIYLTKKEREILFLMIKRKTARAISESLKVSKRTVELHLERIKAKMNVTSQPMLLEKAFSLLNFEKNVTTVASPVDLSIYNLSKREQQCLHYLLKGMTAKEIAKILSLSHRTVEEYIANLKIKTSTNHIHDLFVLFKDRL